MALRGAGSGSGVASFAGSAGGASGVGFLAPAPSCQVAPAEARPPLSVLKAFCIRGPGSSRGLHPVGLGLLHKLVGHLLVASWSEVDRVRPPELGQLLLAGVSLHPDNGADADYFVVDDPLAMG